jgi:hypothetical protein
MKTVRLLLLTVAVLLAGCEKNSFNVEGESTEQYDCLWGINVNSGQDSLPEMTYYDLNTNNIIMLNTVCKRMDFILDEQQTMGGIEFSEDGLVESFSIDSLTICFSNYNGTKVDIAYVYGDELSVVPGVETGFDYEAALANANSRVAQTRSFTDNVLAIDKWLREHQNRINFVFEQTDAALDAASNFMTASILNKLKKSENAFDIVRDIFADKAREGVIPEPELNGWQEVVMTGKEAYELYSDLHIGDGRYNDVKRLRKFKRGMIVYEFLKLSFTNYTDWSNWCEEKFYNYFMEKYEAQKENKELGLAALNSGYGDLKATLSWNFEADIDIHAIEPSGFHIYYSSKQSPYSTGYLDVDNTSGGPGAIENIYWSEPEDGEYTFYIDYFGPYYGESGNCKVALLYKGQSVGVYNVNMSYGSSNVPIRTLRLDNGMLQSSGVRANLVIRSYDRRK